MARASSFLDRINSISGVRAGFIGRVDGVPVDFDKWETLGRLEPEHRRVVEEMGFSWGSLWRAEQIHGDGVAVVPCAESGSEQIVSSVDGVVTGCEDTLLGIYVADCAAVFLADPDTGALALVHSGKKGTEAGIATKAVQILIDEFGSKPERLEAAVSPCIRPPHYELDFVVDIERQLGEAGVPSEQVVVSGVCTGEQVDAYYSYRVEKGKTGRMLALLGRIGKTASTR